MVMVLVLAMTQVDTSQSEKQVAEKLRGVMLASTVAHCCIVTGGSTLDTWRKSPAI